MLPLTQQIVRQVFEGMIGRIQENIRNKPVTKFGAMNASGRTATSLTYEIDENEARMYGAGHIFRLEYGNPPGTKVPFGNIRAWIDDKPITVMLSKRIDGTDRRHRDGSPITIEEQKDSAAWAVKKAIENRGTILHQQGGNSGILADVINEQTTSELSEALFYEFEQIITSTLLTK